jgi:uncharacterized damage-inducible protein DinB
VTVFLVERLPSSIWATAAPGKRSRTVRAIAAHLHNARCSWIKTLGREHGVAVPENVDHRTVSRRKLAAALNRSSRGMLDLFALGAANGGRLPDSAGYVWRNLPLDLGHVLTYFVAHEGHHRGQILMLARLLGHRLPSEITGGIWQWNKRSREASRKV